MAFRPFLLRPIGPETEGNTAEEIPGRCIAIEGTRIEQSVLFHPAKRVELVNQRIGNVCNIARRALIDRRSERWQVIGQIDQRPSREVTRRQAMHGRERRVCADIGVQHVAIIEKCLDNATAAEADADGPARTADIAQVLVRIEGDVFACRHVDVLSGEEQRAHASYITAC